MDLRPAERSPEQTDSWVKIRAMEDYDQLDERRIVNRFVDFATEDGNPALIPVRPRSFSRAVAQQSFATVTPSISTGRPAYWGLWKSLATKVRLREEWKANMTAACGAWASTGQVSSETSTVLARTSGSAFLEGDRMDEEAP